ncbi:unnamed protein product [Penicillium manginii]
MALVRQNAVLNVTNDPQLQRTVVNQKNRIANLEWELNSYYEEDYYEDDYHEEYYYEDDGRHDHLVREKKHLESVLSKRKQTINEEAAKNARLTASLAITQGDLERCRQGKKVLEQKSASLTAAVAQSNTQHKQEVEGLRIQIAELEKEQSRLSTKVTDLSLNRLALQERSTELERERENLRTKNAAIEKEKETLLAENATLKMERENIRVENTKEINSSKATRIDLLELENRPIEIPAKEYEDKYMDALEWNIYAEFCHGSPRL